MKKKLGEVAKNCEKVRKMGDLKTPLHELISPKKSHFGLVCTVVGKSLVGMFRPHASIKT